MVNEQLSAYDGSDPSKPIYLALNGTIYDVTPGRHLYVSPSPFALYPPPAFPLPASLFPFPECTEKTRHRPKKTKPANTRQHSYGPGGGYHFFAGRDAARAFVTGCFDTDLTPDLRGAEDMYIPTDVAGEDEEAGLSPEDIAARDERERRAAREKVDGVIDGWAHVFSGATGKEYLAVGKVLREEGWLDRLPRRELCEKAAELRPKGRVKRKKGAKKAEGKQ
ncbi:hypothetical protein SLS55_005398 [Diplodia seriata]|uniref:Cytochrome b5 heme-binding domain-containing protein n=1 Tax=Diplodia seriata TaxID=420778 RepID=A0ABR3CG95_9PEZI